MNSKLRPLAALAMVCLVGTGCSDGSSESGDTGTRTETVSARDEGVRFAECMRENGVTGFPDPNASGDQEFVEGIERLDPSSAAFKKTIAACKDLRPPGLLGGKASPEEMDTRLEFAQCMRENGVKDFPDPVNGEPLVDTNKIPSAATNGGMTILNAAMHKCGDAPSEAAGSRP